MESAKDDEALKKRIEERAYELFLERGGEHGYHLEDWLKAEKEILAETLAVPKKPKLGKKVAHSFKRRQPK
jgi:hypothetical protein